MNIGDHLASIGILSGADDIDGTVLQEEIMHAAGSTTPQNTGLEGLVRLIESTGQVAVQRNTTYTHFEQRNLKNLPQSINLPVAG